MKYRKLGNTDIDVSVICLGTMTFGEQNSQQEGFDQMDYAVERGVNFFDTAELYAVMPRKETYGKTEQIVGNWFHERKNRDKIISASKIASKSDGLEWIREGSKSLGFDKKNMNAAIDESLKRLKTDYIDLYQLHLSNETPWGVMKYLQISKEKNLPRMMSIQNVYSLVNRVFDIHNSEVSIRENCGLLAYSPLAGGRLSGKYIGGKNPEKARYTLWPRRFSRHHTERGESAIEKYFKLAQKYEIAPSTFANAFVNDRPFVTSNIIGATTMNQLKENIDSIDITLSKEILKEIEEIHLSDPNPCV